jgi:hypothetical protein
MATKLKNLNITKVDFVDEGANPDAHIRLYKRKGEGDEDETKGQASEKPQDNPKPDDEGEENAGKLKKFLLGIAKAFGGANPEQIDALVETIEKGDATSFREQMNERRNRKIADEIWDTCFALQTSLCSILNDESMDSKKASDAMQESLDEFIQVMTGSISEWSSGKAKNIVRKEDSPVSPAEYEVLKAAHARLFETINKAAEDQKQPSTQEVKGEQGEMKIDKSKMTPSELAFLDSIEKRYGMEEGQAAPVTEDETTPDVAKSTTQQAAEPVQATQQEDTDDIYKGLHPEVKAEMESLRKFRDEAENKELTEVAKKYEIIGKKAEDLVPVLKSMRAAGGTAYNDYIAVLDQSVTLAEQSGVFSEIGKSGGASNGESGGAWARAEAKAVELMKSKSNITKSQALDEVFMNDPALAKECEEEE